ncbi:MAG: hypothetical protein ACP5G1_03470 [Nanopusillaceae archaeon]
MINKYKKLKRITTIKDIVVSLILLNYYKGIEKFNHPTFLIVLI